MLCPLAGLYDSIPLPALQQRTIDYAGEPLLWDAGFRDEVPNLQIFLLIPTRSVTLTLPLPLPLPVLFIEIRGST